MQSVQSQGFTPHLSPHVVYYPTAMSLKLPLRIGRLEELANNLWWSWHDEARRMFELLDYPAWRLASQNPVKQLREVKPERLIAAAGDPAFLVLYDSVVANFDAEMSVKDSWFAANYSGQISGPIAYFCAEFALHKSLPIYAGGLGVLAGDLCKEACDLGMPLVGIGFMYPQGYFHQHISQDGWQEETYEQLNFEEAPVRPCPFPTKNHLVQIQLPGRPLHIFTWQVQLGRVRLYLLDTNVDENSPEDRQLTARLYTADREQRIQQEIVLGIGGVRVLRALGIDPSVWHANEGHTTFMMLERIREEIAAGASFEEAASRVKATTVFTTHTPVPAGHDVFHGEVMDRYFHDYWSQLGTDRNGFMQLGQANGIQNEFNMTALGLRMADHRCGVSRLHGQVSRRMWHGLWPKVPEDKVPITHVTNGVHVATWIAPEIYQLCERHLGEDLMKRHDDPALWEHMDEIPDEELWAARRRLKQKLMRAILERSQQLWAEAGVTGEQVVASGTLLDPDRLTIGFVRRFAEYKRPALIFSDIERLKKLVGNRWQPIQIVFAGKSHPADSPSKALMRQTYNIAKDRAFQGRIAFIEDYDLQLARYLVQGVDLWLSNPRRLQEACGTSGMKASINGVPHFSVRDGWWHEAFNGNSGWAIGRETVDPSEEDSSDAAALYRSLEKEIVPLYYDRDRNGCPHGWIRVVKEAIRTATPAFSARRMLKEYAEQMYLPAAQSLAKSRPG